MDYLSTLMIRNDITLKCRKILKKSTILECMVCLQGSKSKEEMHEKYYKDKVVSCKTYKALFFTGSSRSYRHYWPAEFKTKDLSLQLPCQSILYPLLTINPHLQTASSDIPAYNCKLVMQAMDTIYYRKNISGPSYF